MTKWRGAVFPSDLGWIALSWHGTKVCAVTFGHETPQTAWQRLQKRRRSPGPAPPPLVHELEAPLESLPEFAAGIADRLRRFAAGDRSDDLRDVRLDLTGLTPFQRTVTKRCRMIPCGQTQTYGSLAERAGYRGAARAVGQVMACNRFPLIVPCHRVVSSQGLGGFSSPDGRAMKLRLLSAEQHLDPRGRPAASSGTVGMPGG